jgi:hypothetical protein
MTGDRVQTSHSTAPQGSSEALASLAAGSAVIEVQSLHVTLPEGPTVLLRLKTLALRSARAKRFV